MVYQSSDSGWNQQSRPERVNSLTVADPLQLDDRTGSGDLLPLLRSLSVPTTLTRMAYGDAAILGSGPEGMPITVGVEIKQISDILACITDGRFAGHQLPGLVSSYQFVWLIAEGIIKADPKTGVLQTYRRGTWRDINLGARRFMARELEQWLLTMNIKAGIRIKFTNGRQETALFLRDLYGWWTGKDWEEHRAHLAFHVDDCPDRNILIRPSLVRRMAKELPGVGWEKSKEVAEEFRTPMEMVMAEEDQWERLRGFGTTMAGRIVKALRGS